MMFLVFVEHIHTISKKNHVKVKLTTSTCTILYKCLSCALWPTLTANMRAKTRYTLHRHEAKSIYIYTYIYIGHGIYLKAYFAAYACHRWKIYDQGCFVRFPHDRNIQLNVPPHTETCKYEKKCNCTDEGRFTTPTINQRAYVTNTSARNNQGLYITYN